MDLDYVQFSLSGYRFTSEIYATVISLGVTESVYMCDLLLYAISFSKSLCLLLFTDITN